ncbi:peptidyl-prolyl cis-trans isomerase [Prevotella sp. CAG:255]|jgi:peptidyl-prolyl cis-trans isomerase D|uniref:peptidylprolyl isomerase n=1 Tax=Prevotella sp. CAG:255 TaxID=1262923 RepID=UPI000334F39C|nr:peptidylprolyl isomerase [Prevotella sp. CAG:255]CCX70456.1 peptidyl-prolyl cis-trans isomerase [Prevotella sp. CAG:255]HJH77129.1 SurA N-terminal domain-containing protein [Prevotellaceae bacterium]
MAALGKIRSKGVILISILGFALFAFIAEELFRSCESSRNESRQQVGEVLGDKVNVQDFQKLVDEYTNVIKMTQGRDNLTDDDLNQVKDVVWNTFVQTEIISKEASKLGLQVTDQELQNILNAGTNPMLLQTPFVNQQTGRFDANLLKKFLAEYKQAQTTNPQMAEQYQGIYNFWTFIEKSLRQQVLAQKYQSLLAGCLISNPVSAKMAYTDENQESNIQLASFAYSSINDNKVKISDADLKAKYEELKPRFKQYEETRSIKYVDYQVLPSASDRAALNKTVAGYVQSLKETADPVEIVRNSGSLVTYLGIPQTKAAFPTDIAARLDSMAVGSTSAPVENKLDNTINVVKLISKVQLPDSVQFRAIQVGGATPADAAKTADSIFTALKSGAEFEAIAKKYGQTGEKNWITSNQYQNATSMDADTKSYIESLNTLPVNEIKNLKLTQGNLILQITDRKAMTDKYVAAVIKKPIEFSKNTYSAAFNKFSQFVSESQTLDAMQKNASKYGYKVQERMDIRNSEHYVAGIHGTREALKWIFETDENKVSQLYECGDNDHLLVLVMTKINKKGYRSLDDENVKNYVKQEVLRDKKAEMLMAKVKGVNSISAAKAKGAQVSAVNQVTFAAPVFVQSTGMSEPALSGAVAATAKGKFSSAAVKGNGGVYLFQVLEKKMRPVKFNAKEYEQRQRQKMMQYAGNFMQELYINANVKDNRYLFF